MFPINWKSRNWLAAKIHNELFERHDARLTGVVLDLGCGPGPYREDMAKTAGRYVGVDWPASFHDTSGVDVFADLTRPVPFRSGSADAVASFQVMEHLPEPDFFLSECFRVLKKGGFLFVTTPFQWRVHEAPRDYYRYTRHGLEYLLKKNGFEDIRIEATTGVWQTLALKFNYHISRWAVGPMKAVVVPLWWLTQTASPWLDRLSPNEDETASYSATAVKK